MAFTFTGIRRGLIRGQPLAVGALVYGIAFGILAQGIGLSALEAVLMSMAVYSASAQLATVAIMQEATVWTGASLGVVATTIFIVNARYLLFGATLRPWLGQSSPVQAYATLYVLGDANWVMSTRAHAAGEQDAGFIFGSGLVMFLGWVIGTVAGSVAGTLITNPAILGLDFLLVAYAAAAAVIMFRGRSDILTIIVAAVAAFAVSQAVSGGWPIIAAGLAGATVAYVRASRAKPASGQPSP